MLDNIWDYLNSWIRKKFKETFTTDVNGDTAFRVVGTFAAASDDPTEEVILNQTIPLSNTEYTIALPTNTRRYWIRVRGNKAKLRLAFTSGETATNYFTIDLGNIHDSFPVNFVPAKNIFILSSSNNIEVELIIHRKV
jgi:hypothetical protein